MRIETETNLTNVLMGELLDAARTGKFQRGQVVYSAPYEKVEIAVLSQARRKRAHTVPRALLAQKRHSAPYEAIEILPGQSIIMVASGSFEAAWFASPDDEVVEPEPPAQIDGAKWMMLGGALLGACAIVIGLLTFV